MKIKNELNLPQVLVDVVSDTLYKSTYKSYGITTLINKDYCEIVLSRRHWDELEEDVIDNVWALYGSAFHEYIKNHDKTKYSEYKLEYQVGNSKIVGVIDLYDENQNRLIDYKTCSAYKIKKQDYDEWKKQHIGYSWLLKQLHNINCFNAHNIAIIKDYSMAEAKRDIYYPQQPLKTIDFEFTESERDELGQYLINKVEQLDTKYKYMNDDDLPECSEEYRWHSADTWRVFKEGNIRPTKVVWDKDVAETELEILKRNNPKNTYYIEYTKGEDKKCESYCKVKDYCPFYKRTHGTN